VSKVRSQLCWASRDRIWTNTLDNSWQAEQSIEAVEYIEFHKTRVFRVLQNPSGVAQQRSSCCLGIVDWLSWLAGRSSVCSRALAMDGRGGGSDSTT
jgi:hypothetical protein